MCGRYSYVKKELPKEHRFAAKFAGLHFEPHYNAAPSQSLPVIYDKDQPVALFSWGLLSHWAKDPKVVRPINARAETLTEKPTFRSLICQKRCLVPADGFYEWMITESGKVPFRILLKNEEVFTFAGLWDEWLDKSTGELLKSFTIITTDANELVRPIHDRMPVILSPEAEELWLNKNEKHVLDLLKPFPAKEMKAYPISNLVNSPRNNSPEILNSL